jgi:hypothetical protein
VAGRNRTCGAPRFRRALYRLSYGHMHGRGWIRTSGLLLVRQALSPSELLAHELRDKDSNPDLHVQSVVSCRLDDPGSRWRGRSRASVHLPRGRSTQSRACRSSVTLSRSRTLLFKPLAYPSTLDRRPGACRASSYVEELWSPSLARRPENRRLKHTLIASAYFQRRTPRVFLSQAGPRFDLDFVQAEHHL